MIGKFCRFNSVHVAAEEDEQLMKMSQSFYTYLCGQFLSGPTRKEVHTWLRSFQSIEINCKTSWDCFRFQPSPL